MIVAASILAKLNKINSNLNGNQVKKGKLKVPYDSFYIPQLSDIVDIRHDYMRWVHADINNIKVSVMCYVRIYWYKILIVIFISTVFRINIFIFVIILFCSTLNPRQYFYKLIRDYRCVFLNKTKLIQVFK